MRILHDERVAVSAILDPENRAGGAGEELKKASFKVRLGLTGIHDLAGDRGSYLAALVCEKAHL